MFQKPPQNHILNVGNKAKTHAHLSTFGFSPTHMADTKNQKSLNFCLRTNKKDNDKSKENQNNICNLQEQIH